MGVHLLVNTGGGDAPGLNAAIRAVTLSAVRRGFRVTGVRRGYTGLIDGEGLVALTRDLVRDITDRGAGAANAILIPEIDFDLGAVCASLQHRFQTGRPFGIVVVAEGAKPKGGSLLVRVNELGKEVTLGGVGAFVANAIAERTGLETRSMVLGHLQRGGSPTPADRLLALRYGAAAVRLAVEGRWGTMVSWQPPRMTAVSLEAALERTKSVPLHHDAVQTAREFGICVGD
jgi:6-phosphofructokinase 1